MTTRSLLALDLWGRHEARLIALFADALRLLRAQANPAMDEPKLNRELYFCLRSANRNLSVSDRFDSLPLAEVCNQPDSSDTQATTREYKRPDFHWELVDHQQTDPRQSSRFFVVECKRLGLPTKSGWKLNSNYVEKGVWRFVDPSFGYGLSARSGLMIGYVQSMGCSGVLIEVNAACVTLQLASITVLGGRWKAGDVSNLEQVLLRQIEPSPFALRHLWVDLHPRRGKKMKGANRSGTAP